MKHLHLPSALAGAALIVAVALVASAQSPTPGRVLPPRSPELVHVAGIPDPNDLVLIRQEDGPYTVPPGKILVITGLGSSLAVYQSSLIVDGVYLATRDVVFGFDGGAAAFASIGEMPALPLHAGAVITLDGYQGGGRATGYLADERP